MSFIQEVDTSVRERIVLEKVLEREEKEEMDAGLC